MAGQKIFDLTNYLTSGLLVMAYSTILVKVYRGTKYRFVELLVWMLLFSNVMNISYIIFISQIINEQHPLKDYPYPTSAYILSLVLRDISFNESHWIFSAKYFEISKFMPYVISKKDVPGSVFKHDRVTNRVFLSLNLAFPVLTGVAYFFVNS
jgi:hypothetical protein